VKNAVCLTAVIVDSEGLADQSLPKSPFNNVRCHGACSLCSQANPRVWEKLG